MVPVLGPILTRAVSVSRDHGAAVATALAAFGKLARAGIDQADGLGDKDTADVFTRFRAGSTSGGGSS